MLWSVYICNYIHLISYKRWAQTAKAATVSHAASGGWCTGSWSCEFGSTSSNSALQAAPVEINADINVDKWYPVSLSNNSWCHPFLSIFSHHTDLEQLQGLEASWQITRSYMITRLPSCDRGDEFSQRNSASCLKHWLSTTRHTTVLRSVLDVFLLWLRAGNTCAQDSFRVSRHSKWLKPVSIRPSRLELRRLPQQMPPIESHGIKRCLVTIQHHPAFFDGSQIGPAKVYRSYLVWLTRLKVNSIIWKPGYLLETTSWSLVALAVDTRLSACMRLGEASQWPPKYPKPAWTGRHGKIKINEQRISIRERLWKKSLSVLSFNIF